MSLHHWNNKFHGPVIFCHEISERLNIFKECICLFELFFPWKELSIKKSHVGGKKKDLSLMKGELFKLFWRLPVFSFNLHLYPLVPDRKRCPCINTRCQQFSYRICTNHFCFPFQYIWDTFGAESFSFPSDLFNISSQLTCVRISWSCVVQHKFLRFFE